MAMANAPSHRPAAILTPLENDEELAARTLANFGDPPKGAIMTPLYAYRVYKRRKEIAEALRGRREESSLAAGKVEDALVALGERARATAAADENAKGTLEALERAEKLLRSRDQSLAREHDQHKERIASIDQRLAGVETELAQAQGAERAVSADLADAQTQLQRAEARLKQAEGELKALLSRDRTAKA
jgi:chromosome segregation ATPase